MCSLTAAKYLLEQGAPAWDAVLLCAVRWGRATAAGEGSPAEMAELSSSLWLSGTGSAMAPALRAAVQGCHMFPGKYRSCTACSPSPVSVRVPGRDYLCLISSLAALHRPSPSQLFPRDIYR